MDLVRDRWRGGPAIRERLVRRFLRARSRPYLVRLIADRTFAAAAVSILLTATSAGALPPIDLADIAAGNGGFAVNGAGIHDVLFVSGAHDVNGDALTDIIMGEGQHGHVVFGKADGAAVSLADIVAGVGGFVVSGDFWNGSTAGFGVSGVGDMNGDGLAEIVLGGPTFCAGITCDGWGDTFVVFGKADGNTVDLDNVTAGAGGFEIDGFTDATGSAGYSVSDAADVNGDGLPDVIVGAPYMCAPYEGGCSPSYSYGLGKSYVVFGKADGTAVDLDKLGGADGFVINPFGTSSYTARSVSGGGDVNGDGLADLVVGSEDADPNGNAGAGATYIVFGKADGLPVDLIYVANGIGGFVINGCEAGDTSGHSVSNAGDVNGDGVADVIVAAATRSYVVFGKADGIPVSLCDVENGTGGFVIGDHGADADVSGAGDMNRDGLSDLLVGSPNEAPGGTLEAGATYVVFGKVDGAPVNLDDIAGGSGGFVVNGLDPDDHSGSSVAGAGDVDGDGLPDLVIAEPRTIGTDGTAYVVFNPIIIGDLDEDGMVGTSDLLMLLASWGPCPKPCLPYCPADIDQDCSVGTSDLLALLAGWT